MIFQDNGGYIRSDDSEARAHQTRELAAYIWENYIELVSDAAFEECH